MKKIDSLHIRKELYRVECIAGAIDAYKDIATIRVDDGNDYWLLHFSKCTYDSARTIREFENYLIGLENN